MTTEFAQRSLGMSEARARMAHDLVDGAVAVGKDAIAHAKKRSGILKWTVGKIEGPATRVLNSKLGKIVLKIGDRAVTVADGTIDRAMNTGVYKTSSHTIKGTYRWALELADASVEYVLPPDASDATSPTAVAANEKAKSLVGLSRKVSKRATHSIKEACSSVHKRALALRNMKLRIRLMPLPSLSEIKSTLKSLPVVMKKRSERYVTAMDRLLLKYKHTAALRNKVVGVYSRLALTVWPLASRIGNAQPQPTRKVHTTVPVLKNLPSAALREASMSAPRVAMAANTDDEPAVPSAAPQAPDAEPAAREAGQQSVTTPRADSGSFKKSKVCDGEEGEPLASTTQTKKNGGLAPRPRKAAAGEGG